jgi:hypothetical protein
LSSAHEASFKVRRGLRGVAARDGTVAGGAPPDRPHDPEDAPRVLDQGIVSAILVHLSLWDEARQTLVRPGAAARAQAELEYLPWVE